jgi:hypothetical protein
VSGYVVSDEDCELRKAWLKQKFLSYDYHEQLLRDYDRWCQLFEHHWNNEAVRKEDPERALAMVKQVIPRLREVSRPGTAPHEGWKDGNKSGWASTILYNINKGMQYLIDNPYKGMVGEADKESAALTKKILWRATNIRMTSDNQWFDESQDNDDDILNERYTGPTDWPLNWKEDLPHELVASLGQFASPVVQSSVAGGERVPRTGWWFTPAGLNSRRYFQQGELFPEIEGSAYGSTYWQWSSDQTAPKL